MKAALAQRLLDETPDAIIAATMEGRVMYWNKRAASIFGYSGAEAEGRLLTELVVPADQVGEEQRILQEALTSDVVIHETIRRKKDGSLIYVDVSTRAVRDKVGNVEYILSQTKMSSSQRLADLLDASSLLASERDGEQMLARLCSVARETIGAKFAFLGVLSADKRLLKPLFVGGMDSKAAAAIGPIDASVGILARLMEQNGPLRIYDPASVPLAAGLPLSYLTARSFMGIRLRTSTGVYGLLWLLEKLGGGEFRQADERVLVRLAAQAGVAYENAKHNQEIQQHAADLERLVEERTTELSEANKELEAFNYSVAHDLRGPLRHIKGFSEILEEDCGAQMEPKFRQYVGKIQQSAMRMGLLIDDLLRLSQVGRQDLRRQMTDLNLLVRETVRELESENKGRKIEWKIGPLPQIDCDAVLIKQVFVNLLSNAVKYTRPRPRAIIQLGTIEENSPPVFFVRDNGVGFDMKYADKLFGVFQRMHRQEEFEGTGAGLAIVHRILGRHRGRIWAEAAVEKGATFYFTIGSQPSRNGSSDQAAKGLTIVHA